MATNKANNPASKPAAPKGATAAEKSSVTAVAASAAAVGAAGGVNPGTNSPQPDAASAGNVAQPAAETSPAQPDSAGTATEADKTLSPSGGAEGDAVKGDGNDQTGEQTVLAQALATGVLDRATEIEDAAEAPAAAQPKVLFEVRARRERGFHRGGKFWPHEWTQVREGDLTAEQLLAVTRESMLEVRQTKGDEE